MKLDKSKPYGEVRGMPGVCYEQNNLLFDADGNCISKHEDVVASEEIQTTSQVNIEIKRRRRLPKEI